MVDLSMAPPAPGTVILQALPVGAEVGAAAAPLRAELNDEIVGGEVPLHVVGVLAQQRHIHQELGSWETPYMASGELTESYGKWWFIVDFPIKNGDFPLQTVSSPEGIWPGKDFTSMDLCGTYHLVMTNVLLTFRHGKIHPFFIGQASMSMGYLYHGELLVITSG